MHEKMSMEFLTFYRDHYRSLAEKHQKLADKYDQMINSRLAAEAKEKSDG